MVNTKFIIIPVPTHPPLVLTAQIEEQFPDFTRTEVAGFSEALYSCHISDVTIWACFFSSKETGNPVTV